RLQVHADVGTELDAARNAVRTAQGLGEEVEVRRQQRAAGVALDVLGAEVAGPECFLLGLEGHCGSPTVRVGRCCATPWLMASHSGCSRARASTSASVKSGLRGYSDSNRRLTSS